MMLQFLLSESTVNVLTQVLTCFLWQGALLWFAAACLLQVLPMHTASARYAFYCGLLTLLAICPLVTWLSLSARPVAAIEVRANSANEVRGGAASADAEFRATDSNVVRSNVVPSVIQPPDSRLHVARGWLDRQRSWIAPAWLTGVCFMASRLLLGAIGVWRLTRGRQAIPTGVAYLVDRLSRQLAFRMRPAVHALERTSQAMAVGIFKPMVLLPASWISELPSDVLLAVIAHELAHLRRWDLLVNLLQRVIETVLFFHPAVWWCSRRLRIEREMCCDELAQAAIGNRVTYAKALAYLAHQQCSSVESLLAAGIGGKKMVLLDRIRNVLGMPGRHGRLYGPSCALGGAVLSLLAWIAVFGLPASWQYRTSNDAGGVVPIVQHSSSPESADTLPTIDAIEPSIPLDEVTQASEPLTLETLATLEVTSYWDLSLQEAINTAMANSKTMRSLGKDQAIAAAQTAETQEAPASDDVLLARINVDISLAEFEQYVRKLVRDTEEAYWELSFAWRNLETSNAALASARQTWARVKQLDEVGTRDGEAKEEVQARSQYFRFKSNTQAFLNELLRAENRMRYILGIAATDGRMIRPTDNPTMTKVNFDWREITEEALANNRDLRRQKLRVKQRELELNAAKNLLQPRLDLNGSHRWLGLGDDLPEEQIRFYQLNLERERAKLNEEELKVSQELADTLRQLDFNYGVTVANFNRTLAADDQVEAVQAAFEAKTVTLDQLLEAQRQRAEAQASYFRTLLDYQRAIIAVHFRKGSLL